MPLQVRERPRLTLSINATTPGGQTRRWGADEPSPANVPSDLSFTTTMPGGFGEMSCTLPRKPNTEYADLERFSTLRVLGPGGQVAWEGRLEGSPRVSGDEFAVTPNAVGWQAHLEDDKSAAMIYVDRDFGSWGSISRSYQVALLANYTPIESSGSVQQDVTNGLPALIQTCDFAGIVKPYSGNLYDAGSQCTIASIYYDLAGTGWTPPSNLVATLTIHGSDAAPSTSPATATADIEGTNTGTLTAATAARFASAEFYWNAAAAAGPATYQEAWRRLTVWGNHGLTKRGTAPSDGLYASDVVAHAVRTWAPLLNLTTGSSGSVTDSSFIIPQLTFKDPTTAAEIIQGANRYHLRDWAVWENKCFYYHERGARGRSWRARVGPAQLSEAGPSIENLWNGVIVKYQDVDGSTKTVGPTGSGCDTTSTSVMDSDPLNPANQLGIRRWTQIDMGGVSTPAGATEVGRRFLVEAAQYNASGQAQLVGHVEDDKGILRPAWQVRAGDTITFVDAADTSPRRIVRTSYSHSSRTCSVDLDSPPDGLDALLQRLQVVISPLGL